MLNLFYQVYVIVVLVVGVELVFVLVEVVMGYLLDYYSLLVDVLDCIVIVYICLFVNLQGVVVSVEYWCDLIVFVEKYDFKIFVDECYFEIYCGDVFVGVLQVVIEMGVDLEWVVIFYFLLK